MSTLEVDMRGLEKKILEMGDLAEAMLEKAMQALAARDASLTDEVFELEKAVNRAQVNIDDVAVKMIALHQPMAGDLRFITAAMKINADLERVADHAVNIAEDVIFMVSGKDIRHPFNAPLAG